MQPALLWNGDLLRPMPGSSFIAFILSNQCGQVLEPEEQELVDSYERDEWRSVPTFQENLRQYQSYAVATFEAIGLISITLPQEDLNAIREKAAARGMSYQALIATIVHQYVTGDLVEKKPHSV